MAVLSILMLELTHKTTYQELLKYSQGGV